MAGNGDKFMVNGNTADVELAAVGSSPNANGASISGQTLTLQPASGTMPGILTTGAQTIAGAKTFSGAISASNLSGASSGTNTGDVTLAAVGATPNANGASLTGQALNLQPANASYPGAMSAAHYTKLDGMSSARLAGALATVARLFTVSAPATKSANVVHADFAGNTADVKAELDLDTPSAALDTIVEATTAGAAGNNITIAGAADSAPAGGVTISRISTAFTIHWEDGVSTVGDVETAIGALAGADDLFGVKTPGTGATVLAAADAFAATALAGGSDGNAFPGAFTNPDVPRNLRVTFAAAWDGGNVNVVGTDQYDQAVNETLVANPGNVVVGTKVFKTVVSATKGAVGAAADAASIGTGDKLGVDEPIADANGIMTVDGVSEAVTVDATYDGFTAGTNLPNGARIYRLLANV